MIGMAIAATFFLGSGAWLIRHGVHDADLSDIVVGVGFIGFSLYIMGQI